MRKGIKIFGKLLSAFVLLLIIVPMTLSLLLDIPAVQNFAVRKAVRMVSERLGTRVSIDRVDIGLFSRVRVRGFYVEDFQRDTLLYVDRLDAFVSGLGIFGGGIELSRGEIAGARLYLRETPEGEMNIKQVVSRISDPDRPKKGKFKLSIRKASLVDTDFCLFRLERRNPRYGIDFGHMHLYGIEARIDGFAIDGQTIYTDITSLSARERSGFRLDRFAGRFFLANGCLGFENVSIVTERSAVSLPSISLAGNDWIEYKDFLGQVRLEGSIRNSTVSTDDIAYFSPGLRDWHTVFSDVNADLSGKVADFRVAIDGVRIGEHTRLAAEASVEGLPDIGRTYFDLVVPHLTSNASDIGMLARDIGRRELSDELLGVLGNAGRLDLEARFRGTLSAFDMQVGAATDVGSVRGDLKMSPLEAAGLSRVQGGVSASGLKLGELLDRRDLLGDASLSARLDGTVGRGHTDANIVGSVTRLGFNDYVYDSLRFDGRLRDRGFAGRISARDPNLDFDFVGSVVLEDSIPSYDFRLDLRRADLARLHVNRRDSVSQLRAHLFARASGRSLDDLNGRIQLTDAVYRYNDRQVVSDEVTVVGENSEHSKFVSLRSDFADATFRSKTSYRTVFEYLRQSAWKYLPVLRPEESGAGRRADSAAVADDYSLLSVDIRDINPVADAVSSGLQVAGGTSLRLLFNPASDKLSFKASSEYVERGHLLATRLRVNASNLGDSLAVYASAEDLYAGMLHLPHLSVTGGARMGSMQLSAGFDDTTRRISGLLGFRARVVDEHGPDGRVIDLHILPSRITRQEKTWRILARRIQFDTTRVVIDRFSVSNDGQALLLDGVASRSRDDSLTLRLRNFDLAPFTQIVDRMGYDIEGRTNGSAVVKSVLQGAEFTADILLDSLAVNGIVSPPLRLTSRWDFARNRAGVTLADRNRRDTLVRGFYAPAQRRYYARLAVDSLDMGLLDPLLSGVISSTRGLASADLVLQGQRRDAALSGKVRVDGLSTKVDFTQVTYAMPRAELTVSGNHFRASGVPVFDPEGNEGRFDFDLNLEHLSNIAYDVRMTPRRMLVLNTTAQDNDFFYGKVYASGTARVSGSKAGVNMDIAAATDGNSSFFMPLSGRSNVAGGDFVVFVQPERADTLDDLARKKLSFERRRNQRTAAAGQMNISLALDVKPNVDVELTVSGNAVKARGDGTLNLQINPRSNVFEMYGDYTIAEGSYLFSLQNIINKRFTIENGSTIQWTGSPMDAMLDIDAVYKLKASLQPLLQGTSDNLSTDRSVPVECVIHLGDRLTNPAIAFDVRVPGSDPETQTIIANALSTPETVDMQFLYLLLFNSFLAENSAEANSNIGASMGVGTGLEFVSNMLSSWLSTSDYNIVIRYRPKSEMTGDEVDFGLSKSLINNRLFVEVEGNYVIDNKQAVNNNTMSNFMGEAYITYLIDRAGSLKLKAFTQTIDRFDENQGLQETGIGIYYKEDFDNFRDFRRRVKERFTNRKRKARREARKAARRAEKERGADDSGTGTEAGGGHAVAADGEEYAAADGREEYRPMPSDRDEPEDKIQITNYRTEL